MKKFTGIFVQNHRSETLLKEKGIDKVMVSGDTRIDRVLQLSDSSAEIAGLEKFCGDSTVLIGGSTWPKEEEYIKRYLSTVDRKDIKLILAPHNVGEDRLKSITESFGKMIIPYSKFKNTTSAINEESVLLIDSIGLLSGIYQYGHIAIIGGAFGSGLHNILEPSVHGLPSIFGPKFKRFKEAVELVNSGGSFSIKSYAEFEEILSKLLSDKNTLSNAGKGCRAYVDKHQGATSLIISHLLEKHQHFTVNKIV